MSGRRRIQLPQSGLGSRGPPQFAPLRHHGLADFHSRTGSTADNDEIQQILSQGGYIYYSQPLAGSDLEEEAEAQAPPHEMQKLVFGVTGYAQQNSLHILPLKNWPIHLGHTPHRHLDHRAAHE
jgi:hypothetical protein